VTLLLSISIWIPLASITIFLMMMSLFGKLIVIFI